MAIPMSDELPRETKCWVKKRRSQRMKMSVSIMVHRPRREGPQFCESTQTLCVSAHGALLGLRGMVAPKQTLFVQNAATGENQECKVVSVENDPAGPPKVAVEFTRPAPGFWRIAYPPADWK